jgi:hypothetical protein
MVAGLKKNKEKRRKKNKSTRKNFAREKLLLRIEAYK